MSSNQKLSLELDVDMNFDGFCMEKLFSLILIQFNLMSFAFYH